MGWYGDFYIGDGDDFFIKPEAVECKAEIVTKPNGEKVIMVSAEGGDNDGCTE